MIVNGVSELFKIVSVTEIGKTGVGVGGIGVEVGGSEVSVGGIDVRVFVGIGVIVGSSN